MSNSSLNGNNVNLYMESKNKTQKRVIELVSNDISGHKSFQSEMSHHCSDLFCFDYTINMTVIDDDGKVWTNGEVKVRRDVVTKNVVGVNSFVVENSMTSRMVKGDDSVRVTELDLLGRSKSRTLLIGEPTYLDFVFCQLCHAIA